MQLTTNAPMLDAASPAELLDALRAAVVESMPLDGLDADTYARDHAKFEARSDQRSLIIRWLSARIARRFDGPLSILSVGCGDGSVDVAIADEATSTDPKRMVRYVGIEPYDGSAASFAAKLGGLARPGLDPVTHVATFDDARVDEQFDVITFVHSMYYVPDVEVALRRAYAMLRPGGELLVLSAPRGALNQLVGAIAPTVDGHKQWFSDDVAAAFDRSGLELAERVTLDARVDLTDAPTDVLDFTVQAKLTPIVTPLVDAYLTGVALPGSRLVLAHPVDAYRVRRSDSA